MEPRKKEESEVAQSCPILTPWTVAHQAPPSMGFSRQEYWSGVPFPSPGDLPDPGTEPGLPHRIQTLYRLSHQGEPREVVKPTQVGPPSHRWEAADLAPPTRHPQSSLQRRKALRPPPPAPACGPDVTVDYSIGLRPLQVTGYATTRPPPPLGADLPLHHIISCPRVWGVLAPWH